MVRRLVPGAKVTRGELLRAVRIAAADRRIDSLSLVLAGDALLAELHERYMGLKGPTDVLTFDIGGEGGAIEGEVIVSVETARREARRRRLNVRDEVLRYVIHGTLHLLGYDDATAVQRRRMRRRENQVLAELGRTSGPGRHRASGSRRD